MSAGAAARRPREWPKGIPGRTLGPLLLGTSFTVAQFIVHNRMNDAAIVDDAYVFLRYARNAALGNGLVFNPGEAVEGYTSPLWQFLLAGVACFDVDLRLAAIGLGEGFAVATLIAVLLAARRHLPGSGIAPAVLPAVALASASPFHYWSSSGMETALFTFLFFSTFTLFLRQIASAGTMWLTGTCLSLATLSRPDAVILLPVYAGCVLFCARPDWRRVLRQWASLCIPLALVGIHLLWRQSYYQSWLPNTYYAKVAVPLEVLIENGLDYSTSFLAGHLVFLAAVLLTAPSFTRVDPAAGRLLGLSLSIVTVWTAHVCIFGGDHFANFRFFVPVIPIIALDLVFPIRWVMERWRINEPWGVVRTAAVLTILIFLIQFASFLMTRGQKCRADMWASNCWEDVGRWLDRTVPPDSRIALVAVGAMSYYSELYAYDLLGLTNAKVARSGKVNHDARPGHYKYHTDYILSERPDFIVFTSSGLFFEPRAAVDALIDASYDYPMHDLVADPRTSELYDFRTVRMPNGKYLAFYELRGDAGK